MVAIGTALSSPGMATPVIGVPSTSLPSPQRLGTTVTVTASATDTDPGTISYRYEIGHVAGSTLTLVRDFSVTGAFIYTPMEQGAGNYRIVVTARNNSTGNTAASSIPNFKFTSPVVSNAPVITPTANVLTALFSSPPCAAGGTLMRASIQRSGAIPSYTNWRKCPAGRNVDFIIAGMRGQTLYSINSQTLIGGTVSAGPKVTFTTGTPPASLATGTIIVPFTSQDSSAERFFLMSLTSPNLSEAVDLGGAPVWYYQDPTGTTPTLTRPLLGGNILMYANGASSVGTSVNNSQILRQIDLAGNIIRETNASRIGEQVAALSGITSSCQVGGTDCLGGALDHEALGLPNGNTMAELSEEKIFTDGTQGSSPTNPVDIIGDIIVELDSNWQVIWYWRAFDHLNANRAAVLGETCVNNQGGCPPVILTTGIAQDWLHGNAIYYTPSDGSILFSMRHQDWVIKIAFSDGAGNGDTVWTLGKGGDFTINSSDPYPWFSHQHDAGFVSDGTTTLALFDNGNTRVSPPPLGVGHGDSRGYVLTLDQVNLVATPVLLADLGFFSNALGTAELLANGDYHFEAGLAASNPSYSQAIEVFPNATLGFTMQLNGVRDYRNFRMTSLYIPPAKD